jgi:hypothetical protein
VTDGFPIALRAQVHRLLRQLIAAGTDDREVTRVVLFVHAFGIEALEAPGLFARFDMPTCEDWECVAPECQRLDWISLN